MKMLWKILIVLMVIAGIAFVMRSAKVPEEKNEPVEEESATLPAQAGLPEAVEAKRQAIAAAETHEELAALAGENLSYSFGGPYEGGFAEYLRLEEQNTGMDVFKQIDDLLALPHAQNGDIYVWPAVFLKEAKDWTEEDMKMLEKIATEREIEQYREFGAYIGYRIGIRDDGTWLYFIAGD